MLTIRNLTVRYGGKSEALTGVSLEIHDGEMVSVIGRNGAGKSTLLRAISGTVPVSGGEIAFLGQRIDGMAANRIVRLGIAHVPEGRRIFGRMSVRENLELGATVVKDKLQRQETFEFVVGLFPVLKERLKQQAGTLSGGQQQMLAIGRALMSRPKLLLTDEVSMGLSPLLATRICEKLVEIVQGGVSIVLVEQNAKTALEISEKSYLLDKGQIVLSGKASDMVNDDYVKKVYLGID